MQVEAFLSRLKGVKRNGRDGYMALCPGHADKNPSLHITVSQDGKILLKCFAGCETQTIVAAIGIEIQDLFLRELPPQQHTPLRPVYVRPAMVRNPTLNDQARDLLRSRKIDPDYAASLGVYAGLYVDGTPSLIFPFFRNGEAVNLKYRFLHEKRFRLTTDAELIFMGLDVARDYLASGGEDVVICEGELDWLSLQMAGFPAVLSVPNGGGNSTDYFPSGIEVIDAARRVYLAGDADETGQKLEAELMRKIGPEKCFRVRWPDDCNDANDVHRKYGLAALEQCLVTAKPYPVSGSKRLDDFMREYEMRYRFGLKRGLSTGFYDVDPYYTVIPGHITLITGIPNSGKTEWLDHVMVNMSRRHDWKFTMFSPESHPIDEHASRLAEKFMGMPFDVGPTPHMSWEDAIEAMEWATSRFFVIDPEEPTLDEILTLTKLHVRQYGINALIIDPWNEIVHQKLPGEREDEYLSRALRQIRKFAEDTDIHIFIVIHPHAVQRDGDKQYPVIDIYDLHGGSMWANKASAIVSVWRDMVNPGEDVAFYFKKVKTQRIGKRGKAMLSFDRVTKRYRDTGKHGDSG